MLGCSSFVVFRFYEPVKFSYSRFITFSCNEELVLQCMMQKEESFIIRKKEMVLHIYHLLCPYPKFLIPWKRFETDPEGLFGLDRTESWTLGPSRVVSVQYNSC